MTKKWGKKKSFKLPKVKEMTWTEFLCDYRHLREQGIDVVLIRVKGKRPIKIPLKGKDDIKE